MTGPRHALPRRAWRKTVWVDGRFRAKPSQSFSVVRPFELVARRDVDVAHTFGPWSPTEVERAGVPGERRPVSPTAVLTAAPRLVGADQRSSALSREETQMS